MAEKKLEIGMLPEIENISWLQPSGQRVIIKPAEKYALKTKGGIYLPEAHTETMRQTTLSLGEIIAVGSGCLAPESKVGQQVYFFWPEGEGMFNCDGTIYLLFQEYGIRVYFNPPPLIVDTSGELTEAKENLETNS